MELPSNVMEERFLGDFDRSDDGVDWNAFVLGSSDDHLDGDSMLL